MSPFRKMFRVSVLLVGVGVFAMSSQSNAAVIYETGCVGNIAVCAGGGPDPSFAAHNEHFINDGGATLTDSIASATGNTLASLTDSGNGNGAAPQYIETVSTYTDEIVINWAGSPTVTLALNTNLAGSIAGNGWAFAELRLFSYLGGTGSGMFTGGGPGLTSQYAPLPFDGPKCNGFGGFCAGLGTFPTTFSTPAELGFITVATGATLPFVFELRAYTSVGTSGGNYGHGTADLSASLPSFGDIFTVSSAGFDGNIYSTSGLIDNNMWVNPVPEPSTIVLAALGLVGLLAHGHRRRRA